jgi:hypothetical protein
MVLVELHIERGTSRIPCTSLKPFSHACDAVTVIVTLQQPYHFRTTTIPPYHQFHLKQQTHWCSKTPDHHQPKKKRGYTTSQRRRGVTPPAAFVLLCTYCSIGRPLTSVILPLVCQLYNYCHCYSTDRPPAILPLTANLPLTAILPLTITLPLTANPDDTASAVALIYPLHFCQCCRCCNCCSTKRPPVTLPLTANLPLTAKLALL